MILIKNGRVLDPKTGYDKASDIFIKDGKVEKIGNIANIENINENEFERIIDASGKVVAPGLVDAHVHFREPGFIEKEDIRSGSLAAAAGGFTTVIMMANTKPVVDNIDTLNFVLGKARETSINVLASAAITKGFKGEELTDFPSLLDSGAAGLTDDGIPIQDPILLREAMIEAKKLNAVISLHEEDPDFIASLGVNQGEISEKLGLGGAPTLSEYLMVARDIMLAIDTGARLNIQHVSAGVSVELVRMAKRLGADVWTEATPQHFSLTERAVLKKQALARVNPPLRTEIDRQAIIEGLKDGTIQVIVTDHAPHTREEKDADISKAPSGMIGLETSLALGITHLVRTNELGLMELIRKMTINPSILYNLDAGSIEIGKNADLVIFDENEKWVVKDFKSKANNSPFIGEEVFGRVKFTICKGKVVYEEEGK